MPAPTGSSLGGRTALVTGGGRGIGREIALELARGGADVAINYYVEPDLAEATAADLAAAGVRSAALPGDVGNAGDVSRMMDEVVARFGRLDILVNNAVCRRGRRSSRSPKTRGSGDPNELKGSFLCTQAAARHMRSRGGSIVNIGSGCNKVPFPGLVAYTASKGGIEMLTKVAAVELAAHRIRVNCVAPGAIEIERTRREMDDYAGTWGTITPLGRVGLPEDVARAVRFLASDDSGFITARPSGSTAVVHAARLAEPET